MSRKNILPTLLILTSLLASPAAADVINLTPSKDNTLIQRTDPSGQLSNGQGDIFTGRTNQDGQGAATISIRRGLVQFDIASSIPAGATITDVTLTMRDVQGLNGDPVVSLHRVTADWGEGTSFQAGGMGAPATQDDATWLYRFYDAGDPTASPSWNTPGGDFDPAVIASAVVFDDLGSGQSFTWSSPQLVAEVQYFLDNPGDNFGWLLQGDESRGQTAKRLNSGESTLPPNMPPQLMISYTVPEPTSGVLCCVALVIAAGWRFRNRC